MKHVHHDMIVEWAKDTSRVVEAYSFMIDHWRTDPAPNWHPDAKYRFKPAEPKYIVVNGVNVPEPVREAFKHKTICWLADPTGRAACLLRWVNDPMDYRWLSLGLIHLTREAAQAHIDAMLLPSRSDK